MAKPEVKITERPDGCAIAIEGPGGKQWFRIRVASTEEGNVELDIEGSRAINVKPEASNSITISIRD